MIVTKQQSRKKPEQIEDFPSSTNPGKNSTQVEACQRNAGSHNDIDSVERPVKKGGDSTNGYFSRFDVYTGRQENRQVGLGAHVVKTLTQDLKNKYHHVYFDNYFAGVQLLEDMEEDGIYGCGTARRDRRGFPLTLKNPGLKER